MNETIRCPHCGNPLPDVTPLGGCPTCMLAQGLGAQVDERDPTRTSAFGRRWQAPSVQRLNTLFPKLEVLEMLGQGGMGAVYHARQKVLGRDVALKILPPEFSEDPTFAERFTREARALAHLSHHNIVIVYEFGQQGDMFYLLMEYVDGVNLRQAIQQKSVSPKDALSIVPQICDALEYAHEEGVVHRDIKPENILLDRRGRVKIADFGLAKLLGSETPEVTLTGAHQVMGTLNYMAPEQIERPLEVDHRADIFSLGVVFYELLTGQLPLGRFKLPSEAGASDVRLDKVVMKTLEREPRERYQRASEISSAVQQISSGDYSDEPHLGRSPATHDAYDDAAAHTMVGPDLGPLLCGGVMLVLGVLLLAYGLLRSNVMLWVGLGLALGGSGKLSTAFTASPDSEDEPSNRLEFPNLGALLHAIVMIWMGVGMWIAGWIAGTDDVGVFQWVGIGIVLGGAGVLSNAWKFPTKAKRMRHWQEPDWTIIVSGTTMLAIGVGLFVAGWWLNHIALIWIGFGLTMGGGGTLEGAWIVKSGED